MLYVITFLEKEQVDRLISLVHRPSVTAFFAAVEKSVGTLFSTAAKKAVREGLGTRLPINPTNVLHVLAGACAQK